MRCIYKPSFYRFTAKHNKTFEEGKQTDWSRCLVHCIHCSLELMLIKSYSRRSVYDAEYRGNGCTCRKVKDAEDLKSLIRCGTVGPATHIKVHRPRAVRFLWWTFDYSYSHHYMVESATTEWIRIIHYAPKKVSNILLFRGVAEIKEEVVKIENNGDTLDFVSGVFVIFRDKYPHTPRQKNYCVRKARRRLGERQYSVFHNNCDCYVSWTLIGQPISIQAMEAKGLLFFIGLVATSFIRTYRLVKWGIETARCLVSSIE